MEETFKLKADQEFIELIKLLKVLQVAQTGGHAKMIVEQGEVFLNGTVVHEKRKKIRSNDLVETNGTKIKVI